MPRSGLLAPKETPLAVSIEDPPPKAIRISASALVATSDPSSTQAVVGLGVTPPKISTSIPAAFRESETFLVISLAARNGSVIISAFLAPWAFASSPTLATEPTPKWAAGLGSRTSSVS